MTIIARQDLGSGVITGVRHMQPRWEEQLLPDPTTVDITGTMHPRGKRSLLDLGSVSTGYCDRPWCTGKQLPLGLSLTGHKKGENMKKVDLVDCVKQIIAINKTLEDQDQRQDYHVTYMAELRDRIEKLEKQVSSPQA